MEAELEALFVNCQRGVATRMALMDMGHAQPPTPEVTNSATEVVFVNDNIRQRNSRSIDMRFYLAIYRVKQGQFLVYWMAVEKNMEDCFTKHHPTSHH